MDEPARDALVQVYRAALAGADPYASVRDNMTVGAGEVIIGGYTYPLADIRDIYIVSAGKAAAGMARAAADTLGSLLTGGMSVSPYGLGERRGRLDVIEASHPVPDISGVDAARKAMSIAASAREEDLVLCLLSGGASALLTLPAPGLTLEDKQETTRLLLLAGADIAEVNAVRKHLSSIKGGGLAQAAYPAWVSGLMISDVPGDDPGVIASGPASPDTSTYGQAVDILRMRGVYPRAPVNVRTHLESGAAGLIPETPKPGDPVFVKARTTVVASNRTALANAAEVAGYLGYEVELIDEPLSGEARLMGARVAVAAVARADAAHEKPVCLLYGGETTVTVNGSGKGGRNQEAAVAFSATVKGRPGINALFAGTDGIDGPTDAAGGFADGAAAGKGASLGLDPMACLAGNDSYRFLEKTGYIFRPGPTGTNVMDIGIVLIG